MVGVMDDAVRLVSLLLSNILYDSVLLRDGLKLENSEMLLTGMVISTKNQDITMVIGSLLIKLPILVNVLRSLMHVKVCLSQKNNKFVLVKRLLLHVLQEITLQNCDLMYHTMHEYHFGPIGANDLISLDYWFHQTETSLQFSIRMVHGICHDTCG